MRALDHRLLRQFLAIADTGTVRAAARALHMSQPPLTAAIRQLEERLGVALFERSVRGMALTEAGAALAGEARTILARLDRAETRVRAVAGRPRPLRLGFVSAALNGVLPVLLRRLEAAGRPAPRLFEMTTPEQRDALAERRLDAGLLHPPVPPLPDLTSACLGRDPFWAAVPVGHALARRRTLRFADIAGEPFVLFPEAQGPALHATIRALAEQTSGALRVVAEASRVHSQLAIVSGGLGVGLITQATASSLTVAGVVAVPLADTGDRLFLELHLMAEPALARELSDMIGGILAGRRRPA